jgi:hypothetical protein
MWKVWIGDVEFVFKRFADEFIAAGRNGLSVLDQTVNGIFQKFSIRPTFK